MPIFWRTVLSDILQEVANCLVQSLVNVLDIDNQERILAEGTTETTVRKLDPHSV